MVVDEPNMMILKICIGVGRLKSVYVIKMGFAWGREFVRVENDKGMGWSSYKCSMVQFPSVLRYISTILHVSAATQSFITRATSETDRNHERQS